MKLALSSVPDVILMDINLPGMNGTDAMQMLANNPSTAPIAVSDAVGAHVLKDFVALTKVHGDGWGIAHVDRVGQDPRVEVSAGSALDDAAFVAATCDHNYAASLVHLRWATSGIAVQPQNSHPFLADGIAMAHNGSIKPTAVLDELLDPSITSTLAGTTDRLLASRRVCVMPAAMR